MRYKTTKLLMVLSLTVLLCVQAATADRLGPSDVALAAGRWMQRYAPVPRDAFIREIKSFEYEGEIAAYIVNFDTGFFLCGADDILKPVYLYNPHGSFDPEIPDYRMILRRIAAAGKKIRDTQQLGDPDTETLILARRMAWLDLFEPTPAPPEATLSASPTQVPPMMMSLNLSTKWHQGRSGPDTHSRYNTFNQMCPVLTPSSYSDPDWTLFRKPEHCIVGCAATAASQVMYYWKWPESGAASETIYHPYRYWPTGSDSSVQVSVDAAQCTLTSDWPWGGRLSWQKNILTMKGYWEVSLFDYAKTIYDEDPSWSVKDRTFFANALTTLYNNAPYVVTDPYTVDLAAATYDYDSMVNEWDDSLSQQSKGAMRQLSYHAGVSVQSDYGVKGSGSDQTRMREGLVNLMYFDTDATVVGPPADTSSLISDIQWLRPILIRGSDPNSGGHWWIVYGYDTRSDLFQMNMGWGPDHYSVWYDLSGDEGFDYYEDQAHIEMLAPTKVKFVGAADSGDGSPDNPYENIEEALFGDIIHSVAPAPDESVLVFKAGTTNEFAASTLILDRPMTLRGYNVTIRKQ